MITAAEPVPTWLKVLRFPLTRLVVLGGIVLYLMAVNETYNLRFKDTPLVAIAVTIGMALLVLALYVGWAKFIEGRPASELALTGAAREWATGALLGAGLYVGCVVILMLMGIYRIEAFNPLSFLIPAIPMSIKSGVFEELAFRGVLFRSIEDLAGSWIAIAVSSFAFGFVHLTNDGGTLRGAIYITIEAGLLLAAAYLVTRRLWLSIGYHMVWNYTQSAIFSGIVSGDVTDPGLLRTSMEGSSLLTGGSFGMEASIVAIVLCTVNGLILLSMASRRGHILPPPWKRGGGAT